MAENEGVRVNLQTGEGLDAAAEMVREKLAKFRGQGVPLHNDPLFADEPPAQTSRPQRQELWDGKTWDEMNASERATYAARKRWDAKRDARHDAKHERSSSPDGEGRFGSAEPSAPREGNAEAAVREMRRIIDDPKALDTSKVQAARALALLEDQRTAGHTDRASVFLAQRAMLEALPPHDRLAWLREDYGGGDALIEDDDLDLADLAILEDREGHPGAGAWDSGARLLGSARGERRSRRP